MGADHANVDLTKPLSDYRKYCNSNGIEIIYTSRNHDYSTTNLIKRVRT